MISRNNKTTLHRTYTRGGSAGKVRDLVDTASRIKGDGVELVGDAVAIWLQQSIDDH